MNEDGVAHAEVPTSPVRTLARCSLQTQDRREIHRYSLAEATSLAPETYTSPE